MAKYENQQRRLAHRGRRFHFISYDAQEADLKKSIVAMPATWYLESSGRRWAAIPEIAGQAEPELESCLMAWLEAHVFAAAPPPAPPPEAPPQRFLRAEWIGAEGRAAGDSSTP